MSTARCRRCRPFSSTLTIAVSVVVLLLYHTPSTLALEEDIRLSFYESRCFARCLTFSLDKTDPEKVSWEPYVAGSAFRKCGVSTCFKSNIAVRNQSQCRAACSDVTACEESCQFVADMISSTSAIIRPGDPHLSKIPLHPPVLDLASDRLSWQYPTLAYDNNTSFGPQRGVVFVAQYAILSCGSNTGSLDWKPISNPKEELSFDITNNKFKDGLKKNEIYVFRVAAVNLNGTRGFSPISAGYSVRSGCDSGSPVIGSPQNISTSINYVGEKTKEVRVVIDWTPPIQYTPVCYHVCVRQHFQAMDPSIECFNNTEAKSVTKTLKKELYFELDFCHYTVYVSPVPVFIAESRQIQNQHYEHINTTSLDSGTTDVGELYKPKKLKVVIVKTAGFLLNATLTWLQPEHPPTPLLDFDISYGYGTYPIPIPGVESIEIERFDIHLAEGVNGSFTRHIPFLEPDRSYFFRVLASYSNAKHSEFLTIKTSDFGPPHKPDNLSVTFQHVTSSSFTAVITWKDPVPDTIFDHPLLVMTVSVESFDHNGDATSLYFSNVSVGVERVEVPDLPSHDESGGRHSYTVQVFSYSAVGTGEIASKLFEAPVDDSSNLIVIAYVGAPLLVSAIVVIVIGAVLYQRWKQRKMKVPVLCEDMNYNPMYRESSTIAPMLPDEWEVSPARVEIVAVLGEGYFGRVMKGHIAGKFGPAERHASVVRSLSSKGRMGYKRGKSSDDCELVTPVAVKMLKENATFDERRDLLREIEQMKNIGFHSHIVSILGCCTLNEPVFLVVEYVPHGDLLSFLRKNRQVTLDHLKGFHSGNAQHPASRTTTSDGYMSMDRSKTSHASSPAETSASAKYADYRDPDDVFSLPPRFHEDGTPCLVFTSNILLNFGLQIALGMDYLNGKSLIHRDLACRNVLVDDNNVLKISDFGLTRALYKDTAYVKKTKGKLPIKWMSIEAIFDRVFTTKSDVWSFGVVLWEICTMGGFPYPTVPNDRLLYRLREGYRMEKPENCSRELYDVMLDCWHVFPEERPSFLELVKIFRNIISSQRPEQYVGTRVDEDKEYYVLPMESLLGLNRENADVSDNAFSDDDDGPTLTDEEILSRTQERFRLEKSRFDATRNGNGSSLTAHLEVELPHVEEESREDAGNAGSSRAGSPSAGSASGMAIQLTPNDGYAKASVQTAV